MCTISSLLCTYLQIFVVNLCCGLLSWTICATSRPTSRTTRCILYNKSITNGVGALSDETRDQLHSQRSGGIGRLYDASVHTLRDAILRALRRRTFRAAEHTDPPIYRTSEDNLKKTIFTFNTMYKYAAFTIYLKMTSYDHFWCFRTVRKL